MGRKGIALLILGLDAKCEVSFTSRSLYHLRPTEWEDGWAPQSRQTLSRTANLLFQQGI